MRKKIKISPPINTLSPSPPAYLPNPESPEDLSKIDRICKTKHPLTPTFSSHNTITVTQHPDQIPF